MSNPARFLSRWSRLKQQAAATPVVPVVAADPLGAVPGVAAAEVAASIDAGTDLTALLREELSDALRKQALKAIFADPHFNVMDGLDTYIDDYSLSESIPPEMLATLKQARFLFETDEEKSGENGEVAGEPIPELVAGASSAGVVPLERGQIAADCDNLNRCAQEDPVSLFSESINKAK